MEDKIILKRFTRVDDETKAAALMEVAFEHLRNLSNTLTALKEITGYTHEAMLDELKQIYNHEYLCRGCSEVWSGVNVEFPNLEKIPYNKPIVQLTNHECIAWDEKCKQEAESQ